MAPAAAPDRARAGAHLCGPPTAARALSRDSLLSPRNLSALRVWQRCLEKGSTEAARSCSSPFSPIWSPPPTARPPPPRPPPAPPATPLCRRGALPLTSGGSKLGAGPLGRNLGRLRVEAASHSRSWSPGAARASGSPGAGERAGQVWRDLLRGTERTCRSVWSEDCSVAGGGERLRQLPAALGTRSGGDRGTDLWTRTFGT